MTYAMRPFTLHRPETVEQAVALAAEHPGAKYLAGGTDLVVNLRRRIAEPEHVIALEGIGELGGIAERDGALEIGAGTRLAAIAENELVRRHAPVLAEAAGVVAGPTIREMATLGGNLMLDTRCRYYNQSHFWRQANDFCLKKDGTVCHVAPGGTFCWAAFSADTPPALMVLGAELVLHGPQGQRTLPVGELYGTDGRWSIGDAEGGPQPGELITAVRVPAVGDAWASAYEKIRVRDSIDYPLAGLALAVRWDDEGTRRMGEVRMALTAVNPRPVMAKGLDDLAGHILDVAAVDTLAKAANRTGKPMRTTVSDPAYRRAMLPAMVERAAMRLAPELREPLTERAHWA